MSIENVSHTKLFSGWHKQYQFDSLSLRSPTRFAIFLPPDASDEHPVPVLYWLSGLTCTDENFMQKAGACKLAAELGIAIVAPDTSPRGEEVPDDPKGEYDLGLGAGFYLNATQSPWSTHYQMYDYIVNELPELIEHHFPVTDKRAIAGHSMGGHGALTIALKNPERYSSVSAFSPICNPINVPWGQKAFVNYLGKNRDDWSDYDATKLMEHYQSGGIPALIDQGDKDPFLHNQLIPESLITVAKKVNYPLTFRMQHGYDHSYFFISTFIDDHLRFHAEHLF